MGRTRPGPRKKNPCCIPQPSDRVINLYYNIWKCEAKVGLIWTSIKYQTDLPWWVLAQRHQSLWRNRLTKAPHALDNRLPQDPTHGRKSGTPHPRSSLSRGCFPESLQPAVGLCRSWRLLTVLKSAKILSWTKINKTQSHVSEKLKWESTLWWISSRSQR